MAATITRSELMPFVMNVLEPLRTYSSPSRRAVEAIEPKASEPELGSVMAHAPTLSMVSRSGTHRSFWAIVPLEVMAAEAASCAAFVTAFNPFSEPLGDEENEALLGSLRGSLTGAGWTLFEGQGRHPSGEWAPESSLLILGMERGEAAELGARWRQNAVVWVGAGAVPELVLLR